jgi:hypothetical protein
MNLDESAAFGADEMVMMLFFAELRLISGLLRANLDFVSQSRIRTGGSNFGELLHNQFQDSSSLMN